MKTYLYERLKHILWLLCGAILGYLTHYFRTRTFTLTSDKLFFLKAILIGFVIIEVISLFSWLYKRIKHNNQ
ncbi:hypothetical protein QNH39_18705 [Neobacillus novalis]|uniref:Uncharacterized protein n=1 Tax=Neobacillus novalis TaxID=220687 RepID=A0AA95MM05_9BACI|nr:hypothetical protein [Neobacillus novalis]WHY84669.1 hypothetical protein QNH39_18705 [Neobacillus novalis]